MIYLKVIDTRNEKVSLSIIPLIQKIFIIGRYTSDSSPLKPVHLYLDDPSVSSNHCYLIAEYNNGIAIADYKIFDGKPCSEEYSKNGILVNGKKVTQTSLKHKDSINIGTYYKLIYNNDNKEELWNQTQ